MQWKGKMVGGRWKKWKVKSEKWIAKFRGHFHSSKFLSNKKREGFEKQLVYLLFTFHFSLSHSVPTSTNAWQVAQWVDKNHRPAEEWSKKGKRQRPVVGHLPQCSGPPGGLFFCQVANGSGTRNKKSYPTSASHAPSNLAKKQSATRVQTPPTNTICWTFSRSPKIRWQKKGKTPKVSTDHQNAETAQNPGWRTCYNRKKRQVDW